MVDEPLFEGYEVIVPKKAGTYAYPYIARITGTHPQYHFSRTFLRFPWPEKLSNGQRYEIDLMEEGVYEVCIRRWNCETDQLVERETHWFLLFDGSTMDISKEEVLEALKDISAFYWAS